MKTIAMFIPPVVVSLLVLCCSTTTVVAFTILIPTTTTSSKASSLLMIDRNIADMIDDEFYRQHHRDEYDRQWMERNKAQMLVTTVKPSQRDTDTTDSDDVDTIRQQLRDRKLAQTNPQQYCADRCIATGYCDVYEDFFDFTPEQVIEFCTDCVLATNDTEECSIPDVFYDHMMILDNDKSSNKSSNTVKP